MPKIVVYVRAEDARTIAAMEKKSIEEWTRQTLARVIEDWKLKTLATSMQALADDALSDEEIQDAAEGIALLAAKRAREDDA